jgi:transposase
MRPYIGSAQKDVQKAVRIVCRAGMKQTGAAFCYLPPYSLDLNPVEKCWAQVKQNPRSLKAHSSSSSRRPSPKHSPLFHPKTPSTASAIPRSMITMKIL